jgi:hypothetical protein
MVAVLVVVMLVLVVVVVARPVLRTRRVLWRGHHVAPFVRLIT